MSDTPTKQVMKQIIDRVTKSVEVLNVDRWEAAKDLHWARHVINWELTEYESWVGFCESHVMLHPSTVNRYITTAALVQKYEFSNDDAKRMVRALGWTRFANGLVYMTRKMSSDKFIQKYKDWHTNHGAAMPGAKDPNGDRAYSFSLPADIADKLDGYLEHYGMTTDPKNRRRGVRDAFTDLVQIQLD